MKFHNFATRTSNFELNDSLGSMYRLLGAEMSEALVNRARGLYPEMRILHQKVLFAPPQDVPVELPSDFSE